MRQTAKRNGRIGLIEERARKNLIFRKTVVRTLYQVDLALLIREMREGVGLTQAELANKIGSSEFVIARLEDSEYTGHSLVMLERIAIACGVGLKLRAERKPDFDREVSLV